MKRNKVICLDEEVFDFLKDKNASATINGLLKDMMKEESLDGYNYDQLMAEKEILRLEREVTSKSKELRENARVK